MKPAKWVFIPVLAAVLAACGPSAATAPPEVTHFPVQVERAEILLLALLPGTLDVEDGYLVVNGDIILWPYGFTLDTSGDAPRVLDEDGQEVGRVGEKIVLGGGSIPLFWAEEKVGMELPDRPCWLTGNVVPPEEWPDAGK